jgi:hypothetical protein
VSRLPALHEPPETARVVRRPSDRPRLVAGRGPVVVADGVGREARGVTLDEALRVFGAAVWAP